jgi:hypothetical protein
MVDAGNLGPSPASWPYEFQSAGVRRLAVWTMRNGEGDELIERRKARVEIMKTMT